jgi:serine/threonine protein phosphatase 1
MCALVRDDKGVSRHANELESDPPVSDGFRLAEDDGVAADAVKLDRSRSAGRLIYAIGDIHGRADLLDQLLAYISSDAEAEGSPERALLIFLGDYVDRGVDTRAVIDRLLQLQALEAFECRFLKGNHEAAMLDFLKRPAAGPAWLAFGGAETLYSYGVRAPALGASAEEMRHAAEALRAALPRDHWAFFKELELFIRCGDYVFVHAGLRPGKSLEAQAEDDLLTIREPFMRSQRKWPFVVVHGHTPEPSVHVDKRRIGVDTGAYATGKLSAVRLDGENVRVLST